MAADNSKLPAQRFGRLTLFISAHHFNDPVKDLRYCREALKPGGACFIHDADLSRNPEDNMNTVGQVACGASTLFCLHGSMANNGAAFGAEFNEQVLRHVAQQGGFTECKKLLSTPGGVACQFLNRSGIPPNLQRQRRRMFNSAADRPSRMQATRRAWPWHQSYKIKALDA